MRNNMSYINHGQEVYISDIPPAAEEVYGDFPQGPQARGYIPINLRQPSGGISLIYTLAGKSMVKFDEVCITDIPPALVHYHDIIYCMCTVQFAQWVQWVQWLKSVVQ